MTDTQENCKYNFHLSLPIGVSNRALQIGIVALRSVTLHSVLLCSVSLRFMHGYVMFDLRVPNFVSCGDPHGIALKPLARATQCSHLRSAWLRGRRGHWKGWSGLLQGHRHSRDAEALACNGCSCVLPDRMVRSLKWLLCVHSSGGRHGCSSMIRRHSVV